MRKRLDGKRTWRVWQVDSPEMVGEIERESGLVQRYMRILQNKNLQQMISPLEKTVAKIERSRFRFSDVNLGKSGKKNAKNEKTGEGEVLEFEDGIGAKSFIRKKKQNYLKKIFDIEL